MAVAAGLLAAWLVFDYTGAAAREGGPPVEVLIASAPIESGTLMAPDQLDSLFQRRRVPRDFAPVDAVTDPNSLAGSRATSDIDGGAFATKPLFVSATSGTGFRLRPAERAVTVDVRTAPDGTTLAAGMKLDLLASGFNGTNSTELLLSDAEVLASEESSAAGSDARITLRVSAAQTSAVVRGDVFAKELRAVLRP